VDEASRAHCDEIFVRLLRRRLGWKFTRQRPRFAIPTDIHPRTGKSAWKRCCVLHAGGKFRQWRLQGVRRSARGGANLRWVNALTMGGSHRAPARQVQPPAL